MTIPDGDYPGNLSLGRHTGDGKSDGETVLGRTWMFFLGGFQTAPFFYTSSDFRSKDPHGDLGVGQQVPVGTGLSEHRTGGVFAFFPRFRN
jgi:hypothetical protein